MHSECQKFIREVKKKHPLRFFRKRVLEVGSLIINGSPRKHFTLCRYVGIDLAPGLGVNKVHDGAKGPYHFGHFDVVISVEVLEHAKEWYYILTHMYDALKPGGLMIITCAGPARAEHGTKRTDEGSSPFTSDYYKNITIEKFAQNIRPEQFHSYQLQYRRDRQDLCFWGIKN